MAKHGRLLHRVIAADQTGNSNRLGKSLLFGLNKTFNGYDHTNILSHMNASALCNLWRTLLFAALSFGLAASATAKDRAGAGGGREHPNMHEALDALRKAKTSAEPVADLNAAYHRLKQGRQNKEGYRVRAMNLVQQAIQKRKAKENVEAGQLIDEAITIVEKAVTASPNRR